MVKNFVTLALRRMSREKSFTILNILGLSVGIASVLLIFQIVNYEAGYNKNFKNYARIVRMVGERSNSEGGQFFLSGNATSAMISAQSIVPQFEASSRVRLYRPTVIVPDPSGGAPLKKLNMSQQELAVFAEPDFFKIFDFKPLVGEQFTSMALPGSVVLSRQMAEACFGHWENAPGQTLLLDNALMTVRGVIEDAPKDCDFPAKIVLSYATLLANKEKYDYVENWERNRGNDQLYALLHSKDDFEAASAVVAQVGVKEYAAASNSKQIGNNRHFLQPLSDLHFDSRFGTPGGKLTERSRLWVLASIGLFVLLMGCFNFVNLSTAQALRRAMEVGVRKTLGSSRKTLFWQFISETSLLVLMAVVVGTVLAQLGSPLLRQFSNLPESVPFLSQPLVWAFLGVLAVGVALLSGFYPALVLTGFKPASAIKNDLEKGQGGKARLRKGLVVFQFVIAQTLMIGAVVSLQQMNFIQNTDLGFQKDLVYIFPLRNTPETRPKFNTMKQQIQAIPGVESLTLVNLPPASQGSWMTSFTVGRGKETQPFNLCYMFADADFQKTFGVELLSGKWYGAADTTTGYVINETLMHKVGIATPEEAIGQELRLESDPFYPIVGVVKDFHSKPLQAGFEPIAMATYSGLYAGACVKISPQNLTSTTAAIKRVFDDTYPEQVFSGSFFDETIASFYTAEERLSKTCRFFALLAIFISCLGLFGLAAHAAAQRTKEIGVRKVLGASVSGITALLAKDFLKLVVVAIALASPIAYYFMQRWLSDFAYRIEMEWWMFAFAGAAAVGIAFLTVGFQAVKAALANPVKSLRSE